MRKELLFNQIISSNKSIDDNGKINLTALLKSGGKIIVSYTDRCGAYGVHITLVDKIGRRKKKATCLLENRLYVKCENTSISVNELIYQLDRIARGLPWQVGEYNHYFPVCWLDTEGEEFSVSTGDVCSKDQNQSHFNLCKRIYDCTRYKCEIPSYSKAFALLGLKKITRDAVNFWEDQGELTVVDVD